MKILRHLLRPVSSLATAAMLVAMTAAAVQAANIVIIPNDLSGEGLNDVTEVDPIGFNEEPTLGKQRLVALQHAADIWGSLLDSDVTIEVLVSFDPLPCDSNSAVLGAAGPNCAHADFDGALRSGTIYPPALANKLAGTDLCPPASDCICGPEDIVAFFNSSVDTTCPTRQTFYYGLDARPDSGQEFDFVTVALHEIGHGLGFLTFVDGETGQRFMGDDDHFMINLEDHSLVPTEGGHGLTWDEMSHDVQRANSARDNFDLHWVGSNTSAASGDLSDGVDQATGHVYMYAPETYLPGSSVSHFDISLWQNELMEPFYTGPIHEPNLAGNVMVDIGWGDLLPPPRCGDAVVQPNLSEECDDAGESRDCDSDCTDAICGDRTVNKTAGEDCDDAGESSLCDDDCTETSCGDGNANQTAGEECDGGGETRTCNLDCTIALCGDGVVNERADEECDDVVDSENCDADCTLAACGDGRTNPAAGEECDDGEETLRCDTDCTARQCGDGTVNTTAGETCDDAGESESCDRDCTPASCGDGSVNVTAGEACDTFGESTSCNADCSLSSCGDSAVNATAGETCDDGGLVDDDGCDSNCTFTGCGNGIITSGEACDDGNLDDEDGCDSSCVLEEGWTCSGQPTACDEICGDDLIVGGEDCEDGNFIDDDGCDSNCTFTGCGNGIATSGEVCDSGGASKLCDEDCTEVECGDGLANMAAGEECDEAANTATCRLDCTAVACGDGIVDELAGEECDDGSRFNGDGCDDDVENGGNCTETACGNGVLTDDEFCDDGNTVGGDSCRPNCQCVAMVCGDPDYSCRLTANDALHALRNAVGLDVICADWTCDVDVSGVITVSDALAILKAAVEIDVALVCGPVKRVVLYMFSDIIVFDEPSRAVADISAPLLGALEIRIDYSIAAGEFLGDGEFVKCTNLVENGIGAFNKVEDRQLLMGFAVEGGFRGAKTIASCLFQPTGDTHPLDFPFEIEVAAAPNNGPLEPIEARHIEGFFIVAPH